MADSPLSTNSPKTTPKTFTPVERIADLNATDTLISTLLSSAATATGILSNSPSCAPKTPPADLPEAQLQLTTSIDTFLSTLSTVEVRLRRNIYALEEAGLVEAGDEKDAKRGRTLGSDMARSAGGPLDPSWLNAMADNGVEAGLKKQLLTDVKAFLAEVMAKESNGG